MKRWLFPLLILILLLGGCAAKPPHDTLPTKPPLPPKEPEPSGIYIPDSWIEQNTDGAVRQFKLEQGSNQRILPVGEYLLLLQKHDGKTQLQLLSGSTLKPVLVSTLTTENIGDIRFKQVSSDRITYYDAAAQAVVFLDGSIREVSRVAMPKDIQGDAWVSPDGNMGYYCMQAGIYALDFRTGISRLLMERNTADQEITGLLLDGKLLRYSEKMPNGRLETRLISTETGGTMYEGKELTHLVTLGNRYFTEKDDGSVREWIFGEIGGTPRTLWPASQEGHPVYLGNGESVVFLTKMDKGIQLDYYSLKSGRRESALALTQLAAVYAFARTDDQGIWFLGKESPEGPAGLYYWDFEKAGIEDNQDYSSPLYTLQNPNRSGLAECQKQADMIGEKYGIRIYLWEHGIFLQPEGYQFAPEYLVQAYNIYLPRLEKLLAAFPEGFFEKAVDHIAANEISLCLVRNIIRENPGTVYAKNNSLQYWRKGEPCIALGMDGNFESNFFREIAHIADSRILSTTSVFYEWNKLNPPKFAYYNEYRKEPEEKDRIYLEGENRAFIDGLSMSFAKEDRVRILEYACMPDNEVYFSSDTMQNKLRRICEGIRKGFSLQEQEASLLWEQYLKK